MGFAVDCDHYATAIEILGQGVQTRVFSQVLTQLSAFLMQRGRSAKSSSLNHIRFAARRAVAFFLSCFWHRRAGCKFCYKPKAR